MKSKNLILQKVTIIVALIALGLVLISSLSYTQDSWIVFLYRGAKTLTGNNNFFGQELKMQSQVFASKPEAAQFYYDFWDAIQGANNAIFYTSIVGFVLIAVACITGNYSRRRFYISNLVSGLLFSVVEFIMSILCIVKSVNVLNNFSKANPDLLAYYDKQIAVAKEYGQTIDNIKVINANSVYAYIVIMVIFAILAILFGVSTFIKFKNTYVNVKKNEIEKEESNDKLDVKINDVEEA